MSEQGSREGVSMDPRVDGWIINLGDNAIEHFGMQRVYLPLDDGAIYGFRCLADGWHALRKKSGWPCYTVEKWSLAAVLAWCEAMDPALARAALVVHEGRIEYLAARARGLCNVESSLRKELADHLRS